MNITKDIKLQIIEETIEDFKSFISSSDAATIERSLNNGICDRLKANHKRYTNTDADGIDLYNEVQEVYNMPYYRQKAKELYPDIYLQDESQIKWFPITKEMLPIRLAMLEIMKDDVK